MASATQSRTTTILHTSVPIEFAERVRQAAEHEDRSVSYLIRRALTRELRQGTDRDPERQATS